MISAPFSISVSALRQIERIRSEYARAFPDDPPVMPGINLGARVLDSGKLGPRQVIVGFWRKSEFPSAAHQQVQRVSGLDLVFPIPPSDLQAFVGKQIDYAPDRAFFLRDEPA